MALKCEHSDDSFAPPFESSHQSQSQSEALYPLGYQKSYLSFIGIEHSLVIGRPLTLDILSLLQKYHQATIPFDNLELHYSRHHDYSLDPQILFRKLVGNNRGGDCLENNTFFAIMLRSIGFRLITVGAKVHNSWRGGSGKGFGAWTHMVSVVTIGEKKYMVDAHFGGNEPAYPLPLANDRTEYSTENGDGMRLILLDMESPNDPKQQVWAYQHRDDHTSEWQTTYYFAEIEWSLQDFEIISHYIITKRTSWFTYRIVCRKNLLSKGNISEGDEGDTVIGFITMIDNKFKRSLRGKMETLKICATEKDRIEGLKEYFNIVLSPEEIEGIFGLVTQLPLS